MKTKDNFYTNDEKKKEEIEKEIILDMLKLEKERRSKNSNNSPNTNNGSTNAEKIIRVPKVLLSTKIIVRSTVGA